MLEEALFVSVDVDSFDRYLALYGQPVGDQRPELVEATWKLGVRRFQELFEELGIPAVFFVVGEDFDHPAVEQEAKALVAKGHRLGNHTMHHRYDLIRLPEAEIRSEVAGCQEVIRRVCGEAAAVFRAPGYNMTKTSYAVLKELAIPYDTSPLPSYPYLGLKYAVMASLLVRGKRSHSIWGNPAHFLGKRGPYEGDGVTVLPCATTPYLRVPVIGTFMTMLPQRMVDGMARSLSGPGFVGIEFHAIDLVDVAGDGLPPALLASKDLRVPVKEKRERFRRFLQKLMEQHRPWLPERITNQE